MTPDHWTGRNCVVAGGGGFVGAALATELRRRGASVTIVARRPSTRVAALRTQMGCEVLFGDLTVMEACRVAVRGRDDVFLAAAADGNAAFKQQRAAYIYYNNTTITSNLFEACREAGVGRVTYISSADVYPDLGEEPLHEKLPLGDVQNPRFTSYALAKVFGEMAARVFHQEYGMPVAVVRPCNIYGPGDVADATRGRVVAQWIRAALVGDPIRVWGSGDEERSFLYIEDVVQGMLLAAHRYACAQPVNLSSFETITLRALADLVRQAVRKPIRLEITADRPAGQRRRAIDATLAAEVLGFSPRISLAEGIARTVEATRTAPGLTDASTAAPLLSVKTEPE